MQKHNFALECIGETSEIEDSAFICQNCRTVMSEANKNSICEKIDDLDIDELKAYLELLNKN